MMEKNIKKFLFEVMQTYPVYGDCAKKNIITDTCDFILEKLGKEEIDFEKAKTLIFTGYTRKSFPSPNDILTYLRRSIIPKQNPELSDGSWYLLTLSDGRKYSFYPCTFSKTLEEYKEEWSKMFEDFTIQKCSPDSVLIGNELFTPKGDDIGYSKRRFHDYCTNTFTKRIP